MVVICCFLPTLLLSTHLYAQKDENKVAFIRGGERFTWSNNQTMTLSRAKEPAYAKWGQLAMSQVKNKYDADIVDYKHLGRKEINPHIAEEDFKFWLRSDSREFGVYVKIRFEPSTEKVQSISIQEG
jgi:hypothetical protein